MSEKLVVDVNGTKVWYEKVGDGDHVVLLLPGVIGRSFMSSTSSVNCQSPD